MGVDKCRILLPQKFGFLTYLIFLRVYLQAVNYQIIDKSHDVAFVYMQ